MKNHLAECPHVNSDGLEYCEKCANVNFAVIRDGTSRRKCACGHEWPCPPRPATDNVNHPPHYNNSKAKCECGRRIECIDVTRHLNFNIGNAIKYLWRCDLKNSTIEDLKKAIWYIEDEIKNRSVGSEAK